MWTFSDQLFNVIETYNLDVWPAQIVFYVLAILSLFILLRTKKSLGEPSNKIICLILAFYWLWVGIVFDAIYSSSINPLSLATGVICIIEAILIIYYGVYKNSLRFIFNTDTYSMIGVFFIVFALVVYPVVGIFSGLNFPRAPILSAPCPTTIFTFGLFMMLNKQFPKIILAIPLFFAILGITNLLYGIYADIMLTISGIATALLLIWRDTDRNRRERLTGDVNS